MVDIFDRAKNRIYPNPPCDMDALNAWMDQCVSFAHIMNTAAAQRRPMSLIDYNLRTGAVESYGQVQYSR